MAIKAGTENRRNVYLVAGLGLLMLFLAYRNLGPLLFGGGENPAPAPAPAAQPAARTPRPSAASESPALAEGPQARRINDLNLDPTLHPEVMAAAESITYTGSGRNIFSQTSVPVAIEKPSAPARPLQAALASGPPAPPPPPPIDLKFFGYSATPGGVRQAFLLHGEDIFLAHEGDVVDRRYRVGRIAPSGIEVTDIPYSSTQTLPLQN